MQRLRAGKGHDLFSEEGQVQGIGSLSVAVQHDFGHALGDGLT